MLVWRCFAVASLVPLVLGSFACTKDLPPLPEVVLSVDTDLPVPLAVSSLRVDLYDEHGTWFQTAEFARPDPRDWPVSFGVYADGSTTKSVWVRLRAYPTGQTRDYRGEAPHVWGGPMDPTPRSNAPRLVSGGVDVTPASAPWPLVTVDRLLYVELPVDAKKHARVTLHGACLGTSARFSSDAPVLTLGAATTCIDTEKALAPVTLLPFADDADVTPSAVGSWPNEPCAAPTASSDVDRICVAGGATVIGTADLLSGIEVAALPVRTFGLHRFWMDRFEVTVARYRAARAKGFAQPAAPTANDGPLSTSATGLCTWSTTPKGREDYALNCVPWNAARAFCKYLGGDLPTEAQWEHAATVAGRAEKTRYPWGNDDPTCARAAFGRGDDKATHGKCLQFPQTPPPPKDSQNDLSPLGLNALGGGLSEWVIDKAVPYSDPCWLEGPIVDPRCEPAASDKSSIIRGANYILPQMVASTTRFVDDRTSGSYPLGLRCVYATDGGGAQ